MCQQGTENFRSLDLSLDQRRGAYASTGWRHHASILTGRYAHLLLEASREVALA